MQIYVFSELIILFFSSIFIYISNLLMLLFLVHSRVEVLFFFLGNGVLAFSGLSRLLGVLHLPGKLLQLYQETLVDETERLHLVGIGV